MRWKPPRPGRRSPPTSCSPTGPALMTACRRGTRSSPSSSRRPSSSRSTSSAARCWPSPTIRQRRPSPTPSRRSRRPAQRLDRVGTLFGVMTDNMIDAGISGARQGMAAEAGRRLRRDHPQPEALPADQGGLRGARDRRARCQAAAAGDPALRQLRPPRRQPRSPQQKQQLSAYNQQLADALPDLQREGAGRREHLHHRHRGAR